MNSLMLQSFGMELSNITANLNEFAGWPSPATGLAYQLCNLCGCDGHITNPIGSISFPMGSLDTAPAAAAAGFAMALAEPQPEELLRWQEGMKRLVKRDSFPRDRQTFAYRPSELIGLATGISRVDGQAGISTSWIRSVIQDLPNKSPPMNAWALLLYHYAAAIVNVQFSLAIPSRLSEYDIWELGLLITLLTQGIVKKSDFELNSVQNALLQRVATEKHTSRDAEKLAALYCGLSLSLKTHLSAYKPTAVAQSSSPFANSIVATPIMKQRILFLAANPYGTTELALDEECRQITEKIRAADHRDSLELVTRWAVRPEDLLQHLNEHRPHVVHFSGHGTPNEEIVLLDKNSRSVPVSAAALKQLFTTLKDNIRVVVLNACFSKTQAAAITEVVDCAVGMNRAIGDKAAILFAAAFYQAIGFGRSIKGAFESGKTALMLAGIPEEKTPELICKTGVDPDMIVLVEPKTALGNS